MKVDRFIDDAISLGFVLTNKHEKSNFSEVKAVLYHPDMRCLLTINDVLEDKLSAAFLYTAYQKGADTTDLNKIKNSFFYEDSHTGKAFGFVACQNDLFDAMNDLKHSSAKPCSIPTNRDVVSLLPFWEGDNPMELSIPEIESTLKSKSGQFYSDIFTTKQQIKQKPRLEKLSI